MSDKEEGRLRRSRRAAAVAGPLIPYNIADFLDSDEELSEVPTPKPKKPRSELRSPRVRSASPVPTPPLASILAQVYDSPSESADEQYIDEQSCVRCSLPATEGVACPLCSSPCHLRCLQLFNGPERLRCVSCTASSRSSPSSLPWEAASDTVERILYWRFVSAPSQAEPPSLEYYVKWLRKSFRKCTWISQEQLTKFSRPLLRAFTRTESNGCHTKAIQRRLLPQPQVEKVLTRRAGKCLVKYLVKWRGSSYVDCTWEDAAEVDATVLETFAQSEAPLPPVMPAGALDWINACRSECVLVPEGNAQHPHTINLLCSLLSVFSAPALFVVPRHLLTAWQVSFRRYAPQLHVLCYSGSPAACLVALQYELFASEGSNVPKVHVVLTSPAELKRDEQLLRAVKWSVSALDASEPGQIAAELLHVCEAQKRMLLLGPRALVSFSHVFQLVKLCAPKRFGSVSDLDAEYVNLEPEDRQARLKEILLASIAPAHLAAAPIVEERVDVSLSPLQLQLYRHILLSNAPGLAHAPTDVYILKAVMDVLRCCDHPYLFFRTELPSNSAEQARQLMLESSGKLQRLLGLVGHWRSASKHVLIVSQFSRMVNLLHCALQPLSGEPSEHCLVLDEAFDCSRPFLSAREPLCFIGTMADAIATRSLACVDVVIFFDTEVMHTVAAGSFLQEALSRCSAVQRLVSTIGLEKTLMLPERAPFEVLLRADANDIIGAPADTASEGTTESSAEQFWSHFLSQHDAVPTISLWVADSDLATLANAPYTSAPLLYSPYTPAVSDGTEGSARFVGMDLRERELFLEVLLANGYNSGALLALERGRGFLQYKSREALEQFGRRLIADLTATSTGPSLPEGYPLAFVLQQLTALVMLHEKACSLPADGHSFDIEDACWTALHRSWTESWGAAEDRKLLLGVTRHGLGNWTRIIEDPDLDLLPRLRQSLATSDVDQFLQNRTALLMDAVFVERQLARDIPAPPQLGARKQFAESFRNLYNAAFQVRKSAPTRSDEAMSTQHASDLASLENLVRGVRQSLHQLE